MDAAPTQLTFVLCRTQMTALFLASMAAHPWQLLSGCGQPLTLATLQAHQPLQTNQH
jgi:hypothetical protein